MKISAKMVSATSFKQYKEDLPGDYVFESNFEGCPKKIADPQELTLAYNEYAAFNGFKMCR